MSTRHSQLTQEQSDLVGRAVHKAVTAFKVERWLKGSKIKADRPTYEELEECGYKVIKVPKS